MNSGLVPRLSVMMFLQYAIWGAWLPLFWTFMDKVRGFREEEIGVLFAVGASGALLAPFIAGQIADRYFPTEKFLGICHLLGGVLVYFLAEITSYEGLLIFSFLYSLVYSPTLPLTNSLAFHHLPDRDRDFSRVRVWGTVGWIVVGIAIGQWQLHRTPVGLSDAERVLTQARLASDAFKVSAVLGVLMGLYCFFLPHTPPRPGREKLAFAEAWKEVVRDRKLLLLFLLALPMSCIHQFYFARTAGFLLERQASVGNIEKVFGVGAGPMTLGQIAEILVLAAMPFILPRFRRKTIMIAGLLAYATRYAVFAWSGSNEAIIAALTLHGLCFGGFFFVAFLIVDENTTSDVRASAQGLLNLIIVGIGIIVGNLVAGAVGKWAKSASGEMDWTKLWSVPFWATLAVLALIVLFYPATPTNRAATH